MYLPLLFVILLETVGAGDLAGVFSAPATMKVIENMETMTTQLQV